jgi:YesN/AraC family two-component response regulator
LLNDWRFHSACLELATGTHLSRDCERILRVWAQLAQHPSNTDVRVLRAMDYIRNEYSSPSFGLQSCAHRVHLSKSTLSALIKKQTAKTFSTHLQEARNAAAKGLLCSTRLSIKEIAAIVGYAGTRQFDRQFKRSNGVTPGQYRVLRQTVS